MLHLPAVISQQMKYDKTPHREQTPRQRRLWMIGRGYQVTGVADHSSRVFLIPVDSVFF